MRLRPLEYFRRIWRRSWPVSVKALAFYSTVPFGVISALAFVLICSDIFAPFLPADFTTSCNPGTGVGVLEEMNKAFAEFMAHLIGLQGSSRKVIRKAGTLAPIAEEDEEVADAEDVDPCQMPSDRYGPLLKVLNILVLYSYVQHTKMCRNPWGTRLSSQKNFKRHDSLPENPKLLFFSNCDH